MILKFIDGDLSILFYGAIQVATDAARHYPEKNRFELDISIAQRLSIVMHHH